MRKEGTGSRYGIGWMPAFLLLSLAPAAHADLWQENATQTEYDSVKHLSWVNRLGDWRDANGVAQGSAAFASLAVEDTDVARYVEIDVTAFVAQYGADFRVNREGGTNIIFNSREAGSNLPELVLTRASGVTVLPPVADVSMDASTVYSGGKWPTLATQYGFLMRFEQGPDASIQKAVLRLYAMAPQYGNQTLKVFRPDPGLLVVPVPSPSPSALPTPTPTPTPALDFNAPVVRTWTESGNKIYFNAAQELVWETNPDTKVIGDWRDANGVAQGSTPFAYADVIDRDTRQVIQINVTNLVQQYGADFRINRTGGTAFSFHSREATNLADRPVLIVNRNGAETQLQAEADMSLDGSTFNSPGKWNTLSSMYGFMVRFPQKADPTITSAVLQLVTTPTQYGNQRLLVFRPDPHPVVQNPPALPMGTSADIVFQLQGSALFDSMSLGDRTKRASITAEGLIQGAIAAGKLAASDEGVVMNSMWSIPVAARSTEMFARTIMRFNSDFDPDWSGKIPGLANTGMVDRRSVQCGWGGRTADGTCWSARTWFLSSPNAEPFGKEYLSLGGYAYRLNRSSFNGEGPRFNYPIKRGEFFVLDQRVKLNSINADGTPAADGEMTYWLNGIPVLHWTGIVWRNNAAPETLPSEFWGDLYIGGVGYVAPHPHSYTLHSITVSKKLLPFDPAVLSALNGR